MDVSVNIYDEHNPECSIMLLSYTWDTYFYRHDSCKCSSIVI